MPEATISIKKAILVIAVTCILSSVSTWGVINATPSLILTEVSENQAKILRFVEPNEQNVTGLELWRDDDVAVFVWTPTNSTSNAILAVYAYFEYYYENPQQLVWDWDSFWWELGFGVYVNDFRPETSGKIHRYANSQQEWEQKGSFKWEQTSFKAQPKQGLWILPNQNNYTLRFYAFHSDRAWSTTPTFVRNINVVIEVIDGLPAET